jgi:hypothetical protein
LLASVHQPPRASAQGTSTTRPGPPLNVSKITFDSIEGNSIDFRGL